MNVKIEIKCEKIPIKMCRDLDVLNSLLKTAGIKPEELMKKYYVLVKMCGDLKRDGEG